MKDHLPLDFSNTISNLTKKQINTKDIYNIWETLYSSYNISYKKYHNIYHVNRMLTKLENDIDYHDLTTHDKNILKTAIYFHDYFYDIQYTNGLNEKISRDFCKIALRNLNAIDDETIEKIGLLIDCTFPGFYLFKNNFIEPTIFEFLDDSSKEENYLIKLIRDLDLIAFSDSPYQTFKETQFNIRHEYFLMGMNNNDFLNGSINFFKNILMKPRIYGIDKYYETLEPIARENITGRIIEMENQLEGLK